MALALSRPDAVGWQVAGVLQQGSPELSVREPSAAHDARELFDARNVPEAQAAVEGFAVDRLME
jgi:hypothetical protein